MKLDRITYLQIFLVIIFLFMLFLSPIIPSVIPNFVLLYIVVMFSSLILFFVIFIIGMISSAVKKVEEAEEKRKKLGRPSVEEILPGYRIKLVIVVIIATIVAFVSNYVLNNIFNIKEFFAVVIWFLIIFAYVLYASYKYWSAVKRK